MKSILKKVENKQLDNNLAYYNVENQKNKDTFRGLESQSSTKSRSPVSRINYENERNQNNHSSPSRNNIKSNTHKMNGKCKENQSSPKQMKDNFKEIQLQSIKSTNSFYVPSTQSNSSKKEARKQNDENLLIDSFKQYDKPKNQTISPRYNYLSQINSPFISAVIVNGNKTNNIQFQKLGLTLEHICLREGHSRSPILFTCTKQDCENDQKMGCAYCLLEDHADHADQKLRIDDFLQIIQDKYDRYYETIKEFQDVIKYNEEPQILKDISEQIDLMKENTCLKFDEIKTNIYKQYHQMLNEDNLLTAEIVQQQKVFSSKIQQLLILTNTTNE